jgi:hypothetical protein
LFGLERIDLSQPIAATVAGARSNAATALSARTIT